MCLVGFSFQKHAQFPLIVFANRDEFFSRSTQSMHTWDNGLFGGRDNVAGGTWLALAAKGFIGFLTNYRSPDDTVYTNSRGELIPEYLLTSDKRAWLDNLPQRSQTMAGFNLIAGSPQQLAYYSNRQNIPVQELTPGHYALSNGFLHSGWFKQNNLVQVMQETNHIKSISELFDYGEKAMRNQTCALDHQLPVTGFPAEMEKRLSPMFIKGESYGTRNTTLLAFGLEHVYIREILYNPNQVHRATNEFTFALSNLTSA